MSSPKKERKILSIGLMCIDLVVSAPEYPKEDTCSSSGICQRWQCGGNAANDCQILSYYNCPCELWTAISSNTKKIEDTYYAQFLVGDLKKRGIAFDKCVYHEDADCPYSFITLNVNTGTRTIIHQNKNLPELTAEDFINKFDLSEYKWIHFEGRNLEQVPLMMKAIEKWNEAQPAENRITISMEMEFLHFEHDDISPYADYIFVNKEIPKRKGFLTKEEAAKSYTLPTKAGVTLVFPWGHEGALARCSDGKIVSSPAYPPATVVDSLGAGDTFLASTVYALSEGHDVEKAIGFGCRVAGAKCGTAGLDVSAFARRIYEETFAS